MNRKRFFDTKHAFLERLGTEAQAADIPIFVEPIVYDDEITDDKSPAFAKIKPGKAIRTIQELTKDKYHIDILKVEVPVQFDLVEGFQKEGLEAVYTQEEAANYFREAFSDAATRPFIYLSAGVPANIFREELRFCRRTWGKVLWYSWRTCNLARQRGNLWKTREKALLDWLDTQGRENVEELNAILKEYATPWYEFYGGLDNIEVFDISVME